MAAERIISKLLTYATSQKAHMSVISSNTGESAKSSLAIHLTVPLIAVVVPGVACEWDTISERPKSASNGDLLEDIKTFC